MDKITERELNLKNTQGKLLLETAKLEYSKEILGELSKDPKKIDDILEELEITEEDLFEFLSNDKESNISFYDQALEVVREKKKER